MAKKIINVKSDSQKGGITAGSINFFKNDDLEENKGVWANPYFKYLLIPIVVILVGSAIIWGVTKMFGKGDDKAKEIYHVKSDNQKGGVTTGKIENLNILTDKESLGIREADGLYQNGKKVGKVINFNANELLKTFTISEIKFDQPLRNSVAVWQPYEFQDYVIQIKNIATLVTMMPSGAQGVSGIILGKKDRK